MTNRIEHLERRRLLSPDLVSDANGIYPADSVTVNAVAYFSANNGTTGKELWRSDGTLAGTSLVKRAHDSLDEILTS